MPAMLTPVPDRPPPDLLACLPELRTALLEQRLFRLEQLAHLVRAVGAGQQRVADAHHEVAAVLEAGARSALDDIDAALVRMDAGVYGTCLHCGRRMDLDLLRALPQAGLCLSCRHRAHPG